MALVRPKAWMMLVAVAAFLLAPVAVFAFSPAGGTPVATRAEAAAGLSDPHAVADQTTNKCGNCHVPHQAKSSPLMRAQPSSDAPGPAATCISCHNGSVDSAANVARGASDSFAMASGHTLDTTASAGGLTRDCASCHDPHAVSAQRPMLVPTSVNGTAVVSAGNAWCLACHDSANSWYPSAYPGSAAPQRDASGYPVAGSWLGPSAYAGSGNAHRLVPETTHTAGSGNAMRRGQGDCLYCHAAHRGPGRYDGLLATYRPTSESTLLGDQLLGSYAAACFACHGGAKPSGFSTAPADIRRFATAGAPNAGHRVVTPGGLLPVGSPLPCYECHNPHGSKRGNDKMISDVRGASLSTSDGPVAVREFCFTCHTTATGARGWNSTTATYTPAAPGDTVVGIPRVGGVLKLRDIHGHRQGDTESCYSCHDSNYALATAGNNVHNPGTGRELVHVVSAQTGCSGTGCHSGSSLTAIHINAGTTLGCGSCHSSTAPAVVSAITNGDRQCTACHDSMAHPGLAAKHAATMTSAPLGLFDSHYGYGSVVWDVQCSMCHASSDLVTVHAADCGACHSGSEPANSFAVWGKSCQQGACHPTVAHAAADGAHSAIANNNCDTCHENNWDVYYSTCEWCHDPSSAAPVTTSDIKASYVGFAPIGFSAPGVHTTSSRLDGGPRVLGSSLLVAGPVSGTAQHTIEYWSVDDAGREELPHRTATFTISADTLAPTTTSDAQPSYAGPVSIGLSAVDDNSAPVAQTYWKLNGGARNAGKTISIPEPPSGTQPYTLEFWSVDAAGNEESPHKTATFTITRDTAPPVTTTNAPLYDRTTSNIFAIQTATDPAPASGVAVTYRRFAGYTQATNYINLPVTQGVHTFEFWSVDRSGNVEAVKSHSFTRDWTTPITASNAVSTYEGAAQIHLTAIDAIAGVATTYYRLDSDPATVGVDVTATLSGAHTLRFWSVDKAGNVEAEQSVSFTITGGAPDTTGPSTISDATSSYSGPAVIHLTATDIGGVGVADTFYRVDSGAQATGTVVSVAAPASGIATHTLEFWSVDKAGNVETPRKTVTFTCDGSYGTIRLVWGDNDTTGYIPWADSWASWIVRAGGAGGPVIASGSASAGSGWTGIDDVVVPVRGEPYYVTVDWWDSEYEDGRLTTYPAAYVNVGGAVVILRY